jgi:hypothetical protein
LHAFVANIVVIIEGCVVVGLAASSAGGPRADARKEDEIVGATDLMISFVVLAPAVNEKVARVIVVRAAVIMVECPNAVIALVECKHTTACGRS